MIQLTPHKNLKKFISELSVNNFILGHDERNNEPFIHYVENERNILRSVKNHKNIKLNIGWTYAVSKRNSKDYGLESAIYLGTEMTLKLVFIFDKTLNLIINNSTKISLTKKELFKRSNGEISDFNTFYECLADNYSEIEDKLENLNKNRITTLDKFLKQLQTELNNNIEYGKRHQRFDTGAYVIDLKTYGLLNKKILTEIISHELNKYNLN